MGSVNKVILVGNLGRDAELRYTPGGAAVSKFSLATTEVWTDKEGAKRKTTKVRCDRVVLLGGGGGGRGASPDRGEPTGAGAPSAEPSEPLTDDDIPF